MMKNPPHPGEGQIHDLRALGLSAAKAAENLGVLRRQFNEAMTGWSAVAPTSALRPEAMDGMTADHRFKLLAARNLFEIRRRAQENSVGLGWFQHACLRKFAGDSDGRF